MRTRAAALLLVVAMPAYAGAEIIDYGKDSYMVLTSSLKASKAKSVAIKAANAHCGKLGKVMVPRSEDAERGGPPLRSKDFSMVFSCYDQDDPKNRAPDMRPEPDVVVETR